MFNLCTCIVLKGLEPHISMPPIIFSMKEDPICFLYENFWSFCTLVDTKFDFAIHLFQIFYSSHWQGLPLKQTHFAFQDQDLLLTNVFEWTVSEYA